MSELDDLEQIAESSQLGTKGIFTGPLATPKNMATDTCRNGHVRTEQNTRWSRGKRRQRVCIECQRITQGYKGIYKPRSARNAPRNAARNALRNAPASED